MEDSPRDAELVLLALERTFAVAAERVECEADYRAALARGGWDVVLADHALPRFDSTAALRILQELRPDLPLVIVSGTLDEESAVSAMKAGAADYVTKGNLKRLASAVAREVREAEARRVPARLKDDLRESEERFRSAFEHAGIGMALLAPGGRYLRVNPALCRITGYSPEELLALDFQRITHPDDLDRNLAWLARLAAGEIPRYEVEKRYVRKDGAPVWILLTGTAVRGEDGAAVELVAQVQEIGERKAAEAALRASLEEKEVLLKEVHHRVKNNLQVIASLLSLQSRSAPGEAASALLEARGRVHAIALLYERLYRTRSVTRAIDAAAYARDLLAATQRAFAPETRVRCEAGGDPAELGLDQAVPFGLALNELVSNALKHAFPDGREGRVLVEVRAAPGRIALAVEDDGIGLPADLEARRKGSLGLQIVESLARQLGGALAILRTPATRFELSFPREGQGAPWRG